MKGTHFEIGNRSLPDANQTSSQKDAYTYPRRNSTFTKDSINNGNVAWEQRNCFRYMGDGNGSFTTLNR